jgi:hypothetical protein
MNIPPHEFAAEKTNDVQQPPQHTKQVKIYPTKLSLHTSLTSAAALLGYIKIHSFHLCTNFQ